MSYDRGSQVTPVSQISWEKSKVAGTWYEYMSTREFTDCICVVDTMIAIRKRLQEKVSSCGDISQECGDVSCLPTTACIAFNRKLPFCARGCATRQIKALQPLLKWKTIQTIWCLHSPIRYNFTVFFYLAPPNKTIGLYSIITD